MAFSPSPFALRSARYTVTRRLVDGASYDAPSLEGARYVEYCETFADVRERLAHHARGMEANASGGFRFYWVREPAAWFAAAVRTVCFARRQPFIVAKVTNGSRTEWLSVVAL